MQFSWDFLQNMLENGHSNLQTKFEVHYTSNIVKIIQFKNQGIAPTPPLPDLPTLKAYPTPGVGGRFEIFLLKWREKMNLKVPGAILPLGCAILSTRAKTFGGLLQPPLGELGLNTIRWRFAMSKNVLGKDSPILKFINCKIQRWDGVVEMASNLQRPLRRASPMCWLMTALGSIYHNGYTDFMWKYVCSGLLVYTPPVEGLQQNLQQGECGILMEYQDSYVLIILIRFWNIDWANLSCNTVLKFSNMVF